MSDHIIWIVEGTIKSGQLDNFKALITEMVDVTQAEEPDATTYEWFVNGDNSSYHSHERYADSTAVMTHLKSFGQNFAERFFAVADVTNLSVYGNPNDEARAALSDFGARFMTPIGGFTR